jgi:hypothetical protein
MSNISKIVDELNSAARSGSVDHYARLARNLPNTESFDQFRSVVEHNLAAYKASALGQRTDAKGRVIYSMKNEDLYIDELVRRLNVRTNFIIDIGASDGISWSNSYKLYKSGFDGLSIEGNKAKASALISNYADLSGNIAVVNTFIKPKSINNLLDGLNVPQSPDLLSLDIDSFEYDLIETLLCRYRPKIICVEINERLPPPIYYVLRYSESLPHRDMTLVSSASIFAWSGLFKKNHYKLFRLEYNNLIVIDSQVENFECFQDRSVDDLYNDFKELLDREVLFPWNSRIFAAAIQQNGVDSFTDLPLKTIYEVFKSFVMQLGIASTTIELELQTRP